MSKVIETLLFKLFNSILSLLISKLYKESSSFYIIVLPIVDILSFKYFIRLLKLLLSTILKGKLLLIINFNK